ASLAENENQDDQFGGGGCLRGGRGPPTVRPTRGVPIMDWKLELVAIPVSDVDRAKAFYTEKVGFNADHDHRVDAELRFVQLTPPGSACSISFGEGITERGHGRGQGLPVAAGGWHIATAV